MAKSTRTVRFGLSNVYYAPLDEEQGTYSTPVPIPGAVKMALTKVGESDTFYADNIPYATFESNGGYTAELEVAAAADKFLTDCLGMTTDDSGMVVESANDEPKPFALLYEVSSNTEPQRFAFYHVIASRPEPEHNTKSDSTTPDTVTLPCTMTTQPFELGSETKDVVKAHITKNAQTAAAYAKFFDAVAVPTKAK